MNDNNNKDRFSAEDDKLEAAYLDSLRKLGLIGGLEDSTPEEKTEPVRDEPVREEPVQVKHTDPVDVHEYKDPEQEKPEVYDKIVDKINRTRAERSKSIWSEEPVIPVQKSVWLDKEEDKPAPEESKRERKGTRRTIELNLSDSTKRKMREAANISEESTVPTENTEYSSRRRERPAEEQVSSRRRQRPAEEQVSSRRRQRPAEEQVSSRRRVRPAEEQVSSRTRVRPAEEQVSSRTRVRPAEEQVSARTRTAPEDEVRTRSRASKGKKPKFRPYETEFSFLNAALCMVMVFGVGLALVVMKRSEGVIESENRYYAKFPEFSLSSYFKGEYTEGITTYYTDTISVREKFKTFSSTFSKLFGIHPNDMEVIGEVIDTKQEKVDSNQLATTTSVSVYVPPEIPDSQPDPDDSGNNKPVVTTTTTTTTVSTTTKKQQLEVPDEGEWAGNVIIVNKGTPQVRAMPAFYGQFEIGKKYANALNDYKVKLGDKVNVFNMYCPLASAYYAPKNITLADHHECIKYCGVNLKGVINVDCFDALASHVNEYIYSRTDHHWQPLGAYYAAQEFAKAAGVPFPDLSTYEKCTKEGFLGTMYTYSKYYYELKEHPDTFTYYKPDNEYTVNYYDMSFANIQENFGHSLFFEWASGASCYGTILGSDDRIAEVKTDVHNGRTLVLFKDSYGNALVPFLTHSFEKIYVVDIRYLNISAVQFCKNVGATDVLFGMSISGAYTPTHVDRIISDM